MTDLTLSPTPTDVNYHSLDEEVKKKVNIKLAIISLASVSQQFGQSRTWDSTLEGNVTKLKAVIDSVINP